MAPRIKEIYSSLTEFSVEDVFLFAKIERVKKMEFLPSLDEVKKIAQKQKYNVLPVSCEMLSDFTTPIEVMRVLKNVSSHCFMLESAQADEKWGRYTFIGFEPKMEITCLDGVLKLGDITVNTNEPSKYLRQILSNYKTVMILFIIR